MKTYFILLAVLITVFVVPGCNMTPEQRCSLMQGATQFGLSIALNKLEDKEKSIVKMKEHCDKIAEIIEKTILPKLNGGDSADITRDQIDSLLNLLNQELSIEERMAIQSGINIALDFVPSVKGEKGIGDELAHLLSCMFQGVVAVFKDFSTQRYIGSRSIDMELEKKNADFKLRLERQNK